MVQGELKREEPGESAPTSGTRRPGSDRRPGQICSPGSQQLAIPLRHLFLEPVSPSVWKTRILLLPQPRWHAAPLRSCVRHNLPRSRTVVLPASPPHHPDVSAAAVRQPVWELPMGQAGDQTDRQLLPLSVVSSSVGWFSGRARLQMLRPVGGSGNVLSGPSDRGLLSWGSATGLLAGPFQLPSVACSRASPCVQILLVSPVTRGRV